MSGAEEDQLPSFSVVIPTFKRPDALRAAVMALLAQQYPHDRFELLIVDDEGHGRARAALRDLDPGAVPITHLSQQRAGAAAARNRGAHAAAGDVVLFVDDDILVDDHHLRMHAATVSQDQRTLLNGAWQFTPEVVEALSRTSFGRFRIELEQSFQERASSGLSREGVIEMPMLGSWDLSLRRSLFLELGGFDEAFPVAGAEDQEFSLRARAAGCRLLLNTSIVCLHNDDRLDLNSYCMREERSARTMPIIARKFPEQFARSAYVLENRPISEGDPFRLRIKKLGKSLLASRWTLAGLHRLVAVLEARRLPEPALRRLYTVLLGLHLFRGFRRSWREL